MIMDDRYREDIEELERKNAFWNKMMDTFMVILQLTAFGLLIYMFLRAFLRH